VAEALDVLSPAPDQTGIDDFDLLMARLQLSGRLFAGLVTDESLPRVYEKAIEFRTENRGHNWELLRQRAEQNGLYFEPLHLGALPESFAMLWVAGPDLARGETADFDGKFLGIANPFTDDRLRRWNGYSRGNLIPLALYALDYPGVPLLMVDFRRAGGPR